MPTNDNILPNDNPLFVQKYSNLLLPLANDGNGIRSNGWDWNGTSGYQDWYLTFFAELGFFLEIHIDITSETTKPDPYGLIYLTCDNSTGLLKARSRNSGYTVTISSLKCMATEKRHIEFLMSDHSTGRIFDLKRQVYYSNWPGVNWFVEDIDHPTSLPIAEVISILPAEWHYEQKNDLITTIISDTTKYPVIKYIDAHSKTRYAVSSHTVRWDDYGAKRFGRAILTAVGSLYLVNNKNVLSKRYFSKTPVNKSSSASLASYQKISDGNNKQSYQVDSVATGLLGNSSLNTLVDKSHMGTYHYYNNKTLGNAGTQYFTDLFDINNKPYTKDDPYIIYNNLTGTDYETDYNDLSQMHNAVIWLDPVTLYCDHKVYHIPRDWVVECYYFESGLLIDVYNEWSGNENGLEWYNNWAGGWTSYTYSSATIESKRAEAKFLVTSNSPTYNCKKLNQGNAYTDSEGATKQSYTIPWNQYFQIPQQGDTPSLGHGPTAWIGYGDGYDNDRGTWHFYGNFSCELPVFITPPSFPSLNPGSYDPSSSTPIAGMDYVTFSPADATQNVIRRYDSDYISIGTYYEYEFSFVGFMIYFPQNNLFTGHATLRTYEQSSYIHGYYERVRMSSLHPRIGDIPTYYHYCDSLQDGAHIGLEVSEKKSIPYDVNTTKKSMVIVAYDPNA